MNEYKSKVDIVYDYLLSCIVDQKIQYGDRIIIRNVATTCGVSEIPVREALRRLESEGYLEISANAGARFIGTNPQSILGYFEIKSVLEGYAARKSIDFLTENDIKELYSLIDQQKAAHRDNNARLFSKLNIAFHQKIYSALPNKELTDLIATLWKKWQITTSVFSMAPRRMEESCREHEQILSLIQEKKYEETELFVRQHKQNSAKDMVKKLTLAATSMAEDNKSGK